MLFFNFQQTIQHHQFNVIIALLQPIESYYTKRAITEMRRLMNVLADAFTIVEEDDNPTRAPAASN